MKNSHLKPTPRDPVHLLTHRERWFCPTRAGRITNPLLKEQKYVGVRPFLVKTIQSDHTTVV